MKKLSSLLLTIGFVFMIYTNQGTSYNKEVEGMDATLFQTKNVVLTVDTLTTLELSMFYCGDKPIYFAHGNQLWREGDTLYYGFYDLQKQISTLKDKIDSYGNIQMISYRLEALDKRKEKCFTNDRDILFWLPSVFFENGLKEKELLDIKEIVLVLYLYDDYDEKVNRYRENYIKLLESDKGRKVEIRIKDFEIIDEKRTKRFMKALTSVYRLDKK